MSNLLIAILFLCNSSNIDNNYDFGFAKQKIATNLPEPNQFIETFLGQDKNGPYVLTWKNIIINTNNSFIVFVDNQRLTMMDYNIDSSKGEINFKKPLKKNQVARIQYHYLPQYSSKNANPSQVNVNNFTFKSLGLKGLSLTALNNSNSSAAPDMVLSYNQKIGALTANYLTDLNDLSNRNKEAMSLGYSVGNSTNKFNVSYGKSDTGFSPYAKSFNMLDSSEKTSLSADYGLSKTSKINISRSSFKSLNSVLENENNVASFSLNPNKKFNLNFNLTTAGNTDIKSIRSKNNSSTGVGNFDLGIVKVSFSDSKNDSIVNNVQTINNLTNFSINANQLNFNSKDEFKKDNKSGFSNIKTDSISFNSKMAGGNFTSNYSVISSNLNGKQNESNSFVYGMNFAANKNGFGGLKYNSLQTNDSMGNINENSILQTSVSQQNFTYSTNQNKLITNDNEKVNLDDEKLVLFAKPTKNIPVLKFESIDDIKRNDKGILNGKNVDILTFQTINNKNTFNYQFGNISNVISDDKKIDTLVNSGNLTVPIGKGSLFTEFASNNISDNNVASKNDVNRLTFNIAPSKYMPGIELEKSNNIINVNNVATDNSSNKLKVTGKIGQFNVSTYKNQNNVDKNNVNINDLDEHGILLGLPGRIHLALNQTINETPIVEDQNKSISLMLNASKNININVTQSKSESNQNGQITKNVDDNYYEINYSKPNTYLQTGFKSINSLANKIDVVKYRAKLGSPNSLAVLDSHVEIRESTDNNLNLNKDSSMTKFSLNPIKNISFTGAYELNPIDASKPNVLIPIEKRSYGLSARLGNFIVSGSYSNLEHLDGTTPDILAKNGGFNFSSETGYKFNYKNSFFGEYKEQFFNGNSFKGNSIFTLGYNIQNTDSKSLSFSASASKNYNNLMQNNDLKADLKYTFKF